MTENIQSVARVISSRLQEEEASGWKRVGSFPSTSIHSSIDCINAMPIEVRNRLFWVMGVRGAKWYVGPDEPPFESSSDAELYTQFVLECLERSRHARRYSRSDSKKITDGVRAAFANLFEGCVEKNVHNRYFEFSGRLGLTDMEVWLKFKAGGGRFSYGCGSERWIKMQKAQASVVPSVEMLLGIGVGLWDSIDPDRLDSLSANIRSAIEEEAALESAILGCLV